MITTGRACGSAEWIKKIFSPNAELLQIVLEIIEHSVDVSSKWNGPENESLEHDPEDDPGHDGEHGHEEIGEKSGNQTAIVAITAELEEILICPSRFVTPFAKVDVVGIA